MGQILKLSAVAAGGGAGGVALTNRMRSGESKGPSVPMLTLVGHRHSFKGRR